MTYEFNRDFAKKLDQEDPLHRFRDAFIFPVHHSGKCLYFTGNSLGLQPKAAKKYIEEELEDWANFGVEGHTDSRRPWMPYHEFFTESLAKLAGAKPTEVVCMGSLTTNLHLLMVSFFRPSGKRTKILCEAKAFPSDQYALKSQLRFHGLDNSHLIEIAPREGQATLNEADILDAINEHGDSIAMLMMGGVNYYTGQVFDMAKITAAAKAKGITVGWDLAHGMGNVPLSLHNWDVDFAAWCSYKYLNAGPGAVAGIFIHEKHHNESDIPRFEGWWGHDKSTRFAMPETFVPIPTAEAWQLSNAPVLSMAPLRASLDLFDQTNLEELQQKTRKLAGYLTYVLEQISREAGADFSLITPKDWSSRSCQVSVFTGSYGKSLFDALTKRGVIADWREPNVIRMAPVPLYNSFEDIYDFGIILKEVLKHV